MTGSASPGHGPAERATLRVPAPPPQPSPHRAPHAGTSWTRSLAEKRLGFGWIVTFGIGALLIVRGTPDQPRRIAAPVVLLVLYALYGAIHRRKNTPKFADSLYFLGFLWTLVALIDTILPADVELGHVLKAFGYALVTTAAGMLLRSLFLQFHETASEQVVEAQDELDRQVMALGEQFRGARQELEHFRTGLSQRLDIEVNGLVSSLATVRGGIEEAHSLATKAGVDGMAKAVSALDKELQGVGKSFVVISSTAGRLSTLAANAEIALREASGGMGRETTAVIEALRSVANGVREGGKELVETTRTVGKGLQASASDFSETMASSREVMRTSLFALAATVGEAGGSGAEGGSPSVTGSIHRLNGELQHAIGALRALVSDLEGLEGGVSKAGAALERLPATLIATETRAAALGNEALLSVAKRLAEVEVILGEARQAGQAISDAVREVLDFVRRQTRAGLEAP